MKPKVTTLTE